MNIMDTQKIGINVNKIQEFINKDENKVLKNTNFELYKYRVESTFTEFNEKYPTIVKKILQGDNLDYLDKMLIAMDQIEKQNVTKEDEEKNNHVFTGHYVSWQPVCNTSVQHTHLALANILCNSEPTNTPTSKKI